MGETYCFSPWFLGRDPKAWGAASRPAEAFDPQVRRLVQVVQVASALVQPAGEAFDPQVACLN